MRLAHVEEIKNCWNMPLSIWETCLATIAVVKREMIAVAALIVPSASQIRINEARNTQFDVPLACFVKPKDTVKHLKLTLDTLLVVPGVFQLHRPFSTKSIRGDASTGNNDVTQ